MLPTTVNAASAFKTSSTSTAYYYVLKNVGTSKYLNVSNNSSANNTNINVWAKDGTSGENFAFYYDSSSKGYVIVPECSTDCAVNVYGSSAGAGKNICTWTKTGDSTQAWIIKSVSGGYVIQSANNTNYVLTAAGSSNGSNVSLQKYSSTNKKQVWTLSLSKTISTKASFSSTSLSVNAGSTSTMKATFSGPGIASVSWTSSNTSVCTVSAGSTTWASAGKTCSTSVKVTGKTAGTAKVTMYLKDSSGKSVLSKSFTVTVKSVTPSISFSSSSVSMTTGNSQTVKATLKGDINTLVVSSSNKSVATCGFSSYDLSSGYANITVSAKSAGTSTITLYAYNSSNKLVCSKSFKVTVKKADTLTFNITSYPVSLKEGSTVSVKGTVKSSGSKLSKVTTSILNSSGTTLYTSSKSNISSTSFDLSKLSALSFNKLAAGTYTLEITATTVNGTTNSKTYTFKVTSSAKSKTLITDTNLKLIQNTGLQPNSYACGCVALAYCRDIIDNSQHSYTEFEYGEGSNLAWWSAANYTEYTHSNIQKVYKAIYDQINAGKPVVVYVTGGRSTGSHYIAIVGYTGVTDTSNFEEENFLVVDSVDGEGDPYDGTPKEENLKTIGYSLKLEGGVYHYFKYTGK